MLASRREVRDAISRLDDALDTEDKVVRKGKGKGKGKGKVKELSDSEKEDLQFYSLLEDKNAKIMDMAKFVRPRIVKNVARMVNLSTSDDPLRDAHKEIQKIKHRQEREVTLAFLSELKDALKESQKGEVGYTMRIRCWGMSDRLVKKLKPGEIEMKWR